MSARSSHNAKGSNKGSQKPLENFSPGGFFSAEEEQLLLLLERTVRWGDEGAEAKGLPSKKTDWNTVFAVAKKHAVLPLLYDMLKAGGAFAHMEEPALALLNGESRKAAQQSYRLLYRTHQIQDTLAGEGVESAVLKGVATAGVYPVPEMRKSGDVDLLLFRETDLKAAREALEKIGYREREEQTAVHHLVMDSPEGIEVELHTMLAEPFDNTKMNQYMENCIKEISASCIQAEIMGYPFCILSDGYHAYELLLHMLQHYLRSGFGLKLLCDWCFFWNRPVKREEAALYQRLVRESGLSGFSSLVTTACTEFLGLKENSVLWEGTTAMEQEVCIAFMQEIFRAEEFGKTGTERMVMLRGTGLWDYVREFHHQMRLNYPQAGKAAILWPFLWCMTFFRFWRNNRQIRNTDMGSVLKEAGRRSRINEKIYLFRQ